MLKLHRIKPLKLSSLGQINHVPCVQQAAKFHREKVELENIDTFGKWLQYMRFKISPFYDNISHHLAEDKWAKIFCIEGNIGVGKTDFAAKFAEAVEAKNYPQTTDYSYHWLRSPRIPQEKIDYELSGKSVRSIARDTSLEQFLDNPEDVVHTAKFHFEKCSAKYIQFCDAERWLLYTGQGVVLKNNFFCDRAYVHALRKLNWMPNKYYQDVYKIMWERSKIGILPPQVIIYLHVPPEQAYDDVQKSGTTHEKKLPLDFYKYLEEGYRDEIIPWATDTGVNVIEINWSGRRDVDEALDTIDGMPTLDHPYSQWINRKTRKLKHTFDKVNDTFTRYKAVMDVFHLHEEIMDPFWLADAAKAESHYEPWNKRKGFNKKLGDKGFLFKSIY